MISESAQAQSALGSLGEGSSDHEVHTTCCIVGGGPAGMMLAYLFARKGVSVVLLEEHTDFDRDFRGDTVHPSTMQIMAELGLAERLLQLRHTKIHGITLQTASGPITPISLRRLKTPYPYITLMPQVTFLDFLAGELQRLPNCTIMMGARVEALIETNGVIEGVRYRHDNGWHTVHAPLTVGADGRFSRLRRLAQLATIATSPPMDVLWFRLPRKSTDPDNALATLGQGHMMVMLNRFDTWQAAYLIPKGSFKQLRAAGLETLQASVANLMPLLADRVAHLTEWKQVSLLSVEANRCRRWYKPGLLLIGDAAHVMSPVGGVGINYAIQDAVVTANLLSAPLRHGTVQVSDLAAVQRKREWPTRIIQALQTFAQKQIVARALKPTSELKVPAVVKLLGYVPFIRDVPAMIIGFGVWPVHVKH